MNVKKSVTCFEGSFLKLKKRYFKTKSGKIETWEYIERKKSFGHPIIIFALTKEKKVVLEKIYRVPFKCWVLELPAGLQDKKGENEKEVARRELLEETGFMAKNLSRIIQGPMNPGQSTDEAIYYFAKDVVFEKDPEHEDTEEIEVVEAPIKNLVRFIEKSSEKIKVDPKILSIVPILQKRKLI